MSKIGETVLDRALRKLEKLNQDLSTDDSAQGGTEYAVTFTQDGSGQVHQGEDDLLEFKSLSGLMEFLDSKFSSQVRMIRKGKGS